MISFGAVHRTALGIWCSLSMSCGGPAERTGKLGERMEYNSVDDPVKRISLKASGFRILVVVAGKYGLFIARSRKIVLRHFRGSHRNRATVWIQENYLKDNNGEDSETEECSTPNLVELSLAWSYIHIPILYCCAKTIEDARGARHCFR